MAQIYTFRENDITISAEKQTLIDLAEQLRKVGIEGTWSDLVYQIEYEFDIDNVRTIDTKPHYPCDTEPYQCPFDAESGEACRCFCGLGVDEDEPDYPNEDDDFYDDLLMEQREQM